MYMYDILICPLRVGVVIKLICIIELIYSQRYNCGVSCSRYMYGNKRTVQKHATIHCTTYICLRCVGDRGWSANCAMSCIEIGLTTL